MKRILLLIVLCLVGSTTIFAQSTQTPANNTKSTLSASTSAIDAIDDPGPVYTQLMMDWAKTTNFSQNASQVIVQKIKLDLEKDPKWKGVVTPAFLADLQQFFYELFLSPQTIKNLAKVYSQYFTIDDIQELLKFYRSPVGQKLIKYDPELKIKTQQIGLDLLKTHEKEYMKLVAKYVVKPQTQTQ